MIRDEDFLTRFWSGVDRRGVDECWNWLRGLNDKGYGYIRLYGRMEKSHRISWMLENGPIPILFEGLPAEICHSCDNSKCCNPGHLFLGNQVINMADSSVKGRQSYLRFERRGENHPLAVKTDDQVREVKQSLRDGVLTQREIAKRSGFSYQMISLISLGERWSHIK